MLRDIALKHSEGYVGNSDTRPAISEIWFCSLCFRVTT